MVYELFRNSQQQQRFTNLVHLKFILLFVSFYVCLFLALVTHKHPQKRLWGKGQLRHNFSEYPDHSVLVCGRAQNHDTATAALGPLITGDWMRPSEHRSFVSGKQSVATGSCRPIGSLFLNLFLALAVTE